MPGRETEYPTVLPHSAPEITRQSQPAKFRFPDHEMERPERRVRLRRSGRQPTAIGLGDHEFPWLWASRDKITRGPTRELPAMRARGDGRIVHIASQAGVSLTPITGPSYMAAEHAVVALSRSLNAEEGIPGHPQHLSLAGRGGDADPQHAAGAADRRGARADARARGRRRGRALCATLPRRACVTELVLLPTDDRHVRAQAHAIETLIGAPLPPSLAKSLGQIEGPG